MGGKVGLGDIFEQLYLHPNQINRFAIVSVTNVLESSARKSLANHRFTKLISLSPHIIY